MLALVDQITYSQIPAPAKTKTHRYTYNRGCRPTLDAMTSCIALTGNS